MRTILMVGAAACLVSACARDAAEPAAETEFVTPAPETPPAVADTDVEASDPHLTLLASGAGIGQARASGSLGDFRSAMEGYELAYEPQYMVDMSALCAYENDEEVVCGLTWWEEEENPATRLIGVKTHSDRFKTAEGVGVGSSLEAAVEAYGQVELTFSWDNEGREYANFESGPEGVSFRPGLGGENFDHAGAYKGEETLTSSYKDGAVIESIEVWSQEG
ncbi:MAG: hypothetical protein AAFX08_12225 [Pseudomonadota bacterium]